MRLNRVLLLAATINILIFALVLTISCSGDQGPRGKDGTEGCNVKEDSNGNYTVICTEDGDETVVGTLYKGGIPGAQGATGAAGENCWLGPLTADGYEILCGTGAGTSKGFMLGCTAKRDVQGNGNDYETAIICGKTEMNLCYGVAFDPKEQKCGSRSALNPIGLTTIKYVPAYCGKDKVEYNSSTHYCGFAKGDDINEDPNPTTVYKICGKTDRPYQYAWDDEIYCRYTDKENAVIAGESVADFCNGQRINENSWKAQYCGYASATAATKSVLSGACDKANSDHEGAQGPNEIAYGQGYCEIRLNKSGSGNPKPDLETIYSENLCGTSANNKPNNGSWKGEYCGYASKDSQDNNPTKVWPGICADGTGPNEAKFNDGYCTVEFADRLKTASEVTKFTQEFCGEDPTKRPNENEWKNEYCGFGEDSKIADQVLTGVCDDGEAPNSDRYSVNEYCAATVDKKQSTVKTEQVCENGDKINEGSWKGEYCGYAEKKGPTSKNQRMTGACDDGNGPNYEDFGAGYCTVTYEKRPTAASPAFETEYTTEFCKGVKMNEGSWKKEYCGMSKKDADENDKVYKDMCDDGGKPYDGVYPAEQYCQWQNETDTGTKLSNEKCGAKGDIRYNEGKWEGKYCFKGNNTVGTCAAGLVAVKQMSSNDEGRCVSPNLLASCYREIQIASASYAYKTAAYFNKKCGFDILAVASAGTNSGTYAAWNGSTNLPYYTGTAKNPEAYCLEQNGGSFTWGTNNDPSGLISTNNGKTVERSVKPDLDFYVDCAFDRVGDYYLNANNEVENTGNLITKGQCEKLYQVKSKSGIPVAGVYYSRSTTTPQAEGLENNGLCLARNTLKNCQLGGKWVFTKKINNIDTPVKAINYKDIDGASSTSVQSTNAQGNPVTDVYPHANIIVPGQTAGRCEFTPLIPGGGTLDGTFPGAPTSKRLAKAKK